MSVLDCEARRPRPRSGVARWGDILRHRRAALPGAHPRKLRYSFSAHYQYERAYRILRCLVRARPFPATPPTKYGKYARTDNGRKICTVVCVGVCTPVRYAVLPLGCHCNSGVHKTASIEYSVTRLRARAGGVLDQAFAPIPVRFVNCTCSSGVHGQFRRGGNGKRLRFKLRNVS